MGVDAVMYAWSPAALDDAQVHRLAFDLAEAFGSQVVFTESEHGELPAAGRADRPPWPEAESAAGEGGTWLSIGLHDRFYGPGYESGDIWNHIAVAEWIERRIPGCEIWYGGDDGSVVWLFDAPKRAELFDHFARVGHKPRRTGGVKPMPGEEVPVCCGERMDIRGWNATKTRRLYQCLACERRVQKQY